MKKYSTLFLSSAALLASLAQSPIVAANNEVSTSEQTQTTSTTTTTQTTVTTQEETSVQVVEENQPILQAENLVVAGPLTASQTGTTLSIFYNRPPEQKEARIYHGVWSDENGQDDIKWYLAGDTQTDIDLTAHHGHGKYHIHSYTNIQGKSTFLKGTTVTVSDFMPKISSGVGTKGYLDIHIKNISSQVAEVFVPTWSVKNGQDDIQWYAATKNADGTYSLRVNLKQHNFDQELYEFHIYTKSSPQAPLTYLAKASHFVKPHHIPTFQDPALSITNLNAGRGVYQVTIQERDHTKKIQSVEVATWSTHNQNNLKWRSASFNNGIFSVPVDFTEHQSHQGHYQNHVYVTYTDGTRVGYTANSVNLTSARLPVQFSNHCHTVGKMDVTFKNIYSNQPVRYAVWSYEGDQDDLVWYQAAKSTATTYKGTIPLANHRGTGTYHVHVYQGDTGLGTFTMQVSASQRTTEPNTYPYGECTWGTKETAPWAGNWWGNAGQWGASARRAGFKTGKTPKVGAIAVWSGANGYGWGYGHVAVVTAVGSTTNIRVKESNYGGHRYVGDFRGWFNPIADGVTEYIYPN